MSRSRYGKSTLQRIYEIGGADLALRYHEIASRAAEQRQSASRGSDERPEYRLINLRFYARESDATQGTERRYGTAFPRSTTASVFFEIEVVNRWSSISTDHQIDARFIKPDGTEMGKLQRKVDTQEGQQTFSLAAGWGWDVPGKWEPGVYRVEIDVAWQTVGQGEFTISADEPKVPWPTVPTRHLNLFSTPDENLKETSEKQTLANKPKGLGFDGWMKKLKADFPAFEAPALQANTPVDDLTKMQWLHDIDRRYRFAIPNAVVGRADSTVVRELKAVVSEYEKLLKAGPPQYAAIYTEESVRAKIAETHGWIARAAESMQDYSEAEREYQLAADLFAAQGNSQEAERCRTNLASLRYSQQGNFNGEIKRLRAKLAKAPARSLDYAETLIEIAGITSSGAGDDHEAEKLFLEAEKILDALTDEKGKRIGGSSGEALADALTSSLFNIIENKTPAGSSAIQRMLKVNGLQRNVYLGLARIYDQAQPAKARQYRQKAMKGDSRAVNDEFSEAMRRALKGKLGQF